MKSLPLKKKKRKKRKSAYEHAHSMCNEAMRFIYYFLKKSLMGRKKNEDGSVLVFCG